MIRYSFVYERDIKIFVYWPSRTVLSQYTAGASVYHSQGVFLQLDEFVVVYHVSILGLGELKFTCCLTRSAVSFRNYAHHYNCLICPPELDFMHVL